MNKIKVSKKTTKIMELAKKRLANEQDKSKQKNYKNYGVG